jgi:hypothetical protein
LNINHKHAVTLAVFSAAVFAALVPFPRAFIERFYSTFLYAHLQRLITRASNLAVFALFDVLVVAIVAVWLLALIVDVRRERGRWKRVVPPVLVRSVVWASVLYLAFVFLWGFNYRRVKLTNKLQIDSRAISPEGALSFSAIAIDRLNATHDEAHARERMSFGSMEPSLVNGFDRAQRELGSATVAIPGRPKPTLLNPFFRLTGVEGMTDPYFLETLIEDHVLLVERPFVIAHELGHLAGFADESEANFVGWLTCIHGSAADQYSGWLFVYEELIPVVRDHDRSELVRRLAPGPKEDLRAIVEREQRQVSPRASHISSLVYDRYLKANRIQSGVANYNEVAGLLLGVRFGPDWTPKLNRTASTQRTPQ